MKIRTGKQKPKAYRVVVYGTEGIGKTTLASKMPKPLFIDIERGTHGIDVASVEIGDAMTFAEIMGIVNELINDHQGYSTLVIDSLDMLEKQIAQEICDKAGKDSIADVGDWGKGYTIVHDRFGRLLDKLSNLVDSGMNVVCLAHSQLQLQTLPDEQGSFDRYELKLQRKQVAPIVKEWCDTLIFVNYKTNVVEVKGDTKKKAQGGKRWAYSEHRPAFDAKHRASLDIPEECSIERATEALAKALSGMEGKTNEVKAETGTDDVGLAVNVAGSDAEANDVSDAQDTGSANVSEPPYVALLRKSLKQYNVTEQQIKNYSAPKLLDRYGLVDCELAQIPKEFCDWLVKGMDKISKKI